MATNQPQDDYQKTALRVPRELHAKLHEAAAASGRSFNAEIVARLTDSFKPLSGAHAQPLVERVRTLEEAISTIANGLEAMMKNAQ